MLQWLVYLLCPLMMIGCMAGVLRPGTRGAVSTRSMSLLPRRGPQEEIAGLRAAQDDLARRIDLLAARIDDPEAVAPRRAEGSGR